MRVSIAIQGVLIIALQGVLYSQSNFSDSVDSYKPNVEFFMEEITLEVTDSTAHVKGVYYFSNNTSKEFDFPVLFPFYTDSLISYPHVIEPYLLENGQKNKLSYKDSPNFSGIRFRIPLQADKVTAWHLDYCQKISAKRAVYIITSTAAWKKPLDKATYYFIAPESFSGVEVWPEADTAYMDNGNIIYKCVRENFMPSQDMEILWK